MGKLSFSIAINLLADNFKKGTNQVKASLRAMQMQFLTFAAALGAGSWSLSSFFSRLISTIRETSRAITALKNVSGGLAEYANSQAFLLKIAKQYGQEINSLTFSFSKFTAAATQAGMSVQDQRKIFESVSRANTAFGLTIDESNGVFLALSQMMGKGKISSEELRKQMGEKMPIALQAMAKAVGVSMAELERLMKAGKVMSAEVLPKFADALNEMLPEVDTDNVESSINRLSTAFTDFAEKTNIRSAYKKLIDKITELVQYGADNIKKIINNLVAVIAAYAGSRFFRWIRSELAISQRAARIAAQQAAREAKVAFDKTAWEAEKASRTIKMSFMRAGNSIKAAFASIVPFLLIGIVTGLLARLANVREEAKRIKAIFGDYQKESLAIGRPEEVDQLQRLYKIVKDVNLSYDVRKNALAKINEMMGTSYSIDQSTLRINGDINEKIAKRIDLLKSAASVEFYQRKKLEAEDKQREILSKYGGELSTFQKAIDRASNQPANQNFGSGWITPKQVKKDTAEWNQFSKIIKDAGKQLDYFEKNILSQGSTTLIPTEEKETEIQKAEKEYVEALAILTRQKDNEAISAKEYQKGLDDLNEKTYKKLAGILTPDQAANNKIYQAAKSGYNSSEFSKIESKYYSGVNDLADQHALNLMTDREFASARETLIQSTLKEVAALDALTAAEHSFISDLSDRAKQLKTQAKYDGIIDDYNEELEKLTNQYAAGVLAEADYRVSLSDLNEKTLVLGASLLGAAVATDDFFKNLKAEKKQGFAPLAKSWEYSSDDILSSSKSAQEVLDRLRLSAGESAKELLSELEEAMMRAPTLEDALQIAQARQAVKEFNKELSKSIYSGLKDTVRDADGIVNAFKTAKETIENVDASGWERVMAVWNVMTGTLDGFLSLIDTIKKMTEIVDKLALAKEAEAVIDTTTTSTKIANKGAEVLADNVYTQTKLSNSSAEVGANMGAAASEAGKSAAKLPFPVNLIAISAAIAGTIALFRAIPKFAGGGIVQGSPTGDLNLARVNGGEMILNGNQQKTLFDLLDGGMRSGTMGGGDVEFKIKGEELVGVIKKHERRVSRFR